jgi:23S rRNA (uracil1939-C5)-methyltransferase
LGGLDLPDPEIEAAPQPWAYRNKLTLAVGEEGRRIGLHPLGRPQAVFDLVRCEIAATELQELWSAVRSLRDLLPRGLTHLVLRLDADGGRHLILRTGVGSRPPDVDQLGRRLRTTGGPVVVWWEPADGAARVISGGKDAYPAVVFEQVNPAFARRIRQFAIERLGPVEGRLVWDLYAGIGDTSLALAERGARVEMVERDARAVRLAERGWRAARGLPVEGQAPLDLPVTAHAGAAEELVPALPRPDLVVANPPRVGMEERVVAALREKEPGRIVYVSCDPATLARDVKRLGPEYRVSEVRAFDLFPETAHVETVLVLERSA